MDLPMDNEDALRDNLDIEANEGAPIPADIDEGQERMLDDDEDDDEDMDEPLDLHSLGSRFRNIGVRAIFDDLESGSDSEPSAPIVLYLLYADLRQDIVQELRNWIVSERFEMCRIVDMLESWTLFDIAQEVEQEHAVAFLEIVETLGRLMVEALRESQDVSLALQDLTLPLYAPLGAIVVAKLLHYIQSVESVKTLTLSCDQQYRTFRPDEVEQLVSSILHLKQLNELEIQLDLTGVLFVELCPRLKELENLSHLCIRGHNENSPGELPTERQLVRQIQQISTLQSLHLYSVLLRASTVDLFSSPGAAYTNLALERCRFVIGDDDENNDPSELPLAVALASNTRLVELSLNSVQGSGAFFAGMEQGLLWNGTLRILCVTDYDSPANQLIPEPVYFGWIQSIRLHPSLRCLELDMRGWSDRVADAVCSVVRDNTTLASLGLLYKGRLERSDNEYDPEWVGAVLQALEANRTIIGVGIEAGSDFNYRNWNRLAGLLNVNDSIQYIYLDAGDESIPEHVIELLQRVKSNRTLESLRVKNACFRYEHTSSLVELLADNYVLASLVDQPVRERQSIHCSDEGSQLLLGGILDMNLLGRKYMRTDPNSVLHGVSLVSHFLSNLDVVYFHLRENPRLCDRREWKQDLTLSL